MTEFNYTQIYDHTFVVAGGRKVAIQNELDGVAIFVEGYADPVAYIDFYYLNAEGKHEYHREPAPQVVIYDTAAPDGDPVAFIKLEPQGTRVAFEHGVKVVEHDEQYGEMWGYET